MSLLNGAYGLFQDKAVEQGAQVSIRPASQDCYQKVTRWMKWVVGYPIILLHGVYNATLMLKHRELLKPIQANIYQGNAIHYVPFLPGQVRYHVVTSPQIMHAMAPEYRTDDKEGLFTDVKTTIFTLPLARDVCNDSNVSQEDFLLTCSAEKVDSYRETLLLFMGSAQIASLKSQMDEVIEETLVFLRGKERNGIVSTDAAELAGTYTVAVISKLFLGHPGPFEEYEKIGKAIQCALNFSVRRAWSSPPAEEVRKYEDSVRVLREAIDSSKGPFVDFLNERDMTPLQRKCMLLLTYVGGSETSASLLKYLLWKVGQEKQYQGGVVTIDQLFSEAIRMFTPAYGIARFANQDIELEVKNRTGSWRHLIRKGEGILYCSTIAARDPSIYSHPTTFDPHRPKPAPSLQHKPFGEGKHFCPGQWLAKMDITALATALMATYEISSKPDKQDLDVKAYMTLKAEDVHLVLKRRNVDGVHGT